MLLEIIDYPHLLWTDINYTCQLCIALSTLFLYLHLSGRMCTFRHCAFGTPPPLLVPCSHLCGARRNYNAPISAPGPWTEEWAPGYLRYPRPPFPLSATEKRSNGMILQQFDAKTFHLSFCDPSLQPIATCIATLWNLAWRRTHYSRSNIRQNVHPLCRTNMRSVHSYRSHFPRNSFVTCIQAGTGMPKSLSETRLDPFSAWPGYYNFWG